MLKDFRTFRRDPAQWAQVAIFLVPGLLYFANIRRFHTDTLGTDSMGRMYQNAVSMINLAATALLLCTYTGRFIYPMLSLEGRKFWILGLLPLQRERLLWGKFAFSATWSIVVAETLIVMSDLMLGVSLAILAVHVLTILTVALGLSGISVGLGATMANFRESDPSKIAVGMGGTLNLAAGLLFLLLEVLLMAGPWHFRMASDGAAHSPAFPVVAILCMFAALIIGVLAVVVPMRLEQRRCGDGVLTAPPHRRWRHVRLRGAAAEGTRRPAADGRPRRARRGVRPGSAAAAFTPVGIWPAALVAAAAPLSSFATASRKPASSASSTA